MPMMRRMHTPKQQGVTLIELVMVLVIIGVLAAMAAPRLSITDSSVHAQAAQIARDIRHAQLLAMAGGETLTFQSLGGSYRCTDSTAAVITDPATQQPFNLTLVNSVALTAASVSFDSLGRPVSAGALLAAAVTFTVSGGAQSAAISISPVTGFVTVTP
jgi:MSHA pilin protein MshC